MDVTEVEDENSPLTMLIEVVNREDTNINMNVDNCDQITEILPSTDDKDDEVNPHLDALVDIVNRDQNVNSNSSEVHQRDTESDCDKITTTSAHPSNESEISNVGNNSFSISAQLNESEIINRSIESTLSPHISETSASESIVSCSQKTPKKNSTQSRPSSRYYNSIAALLKHQHDSGSVDSGNERREGSVDLENNDQMKPEDTKSVTNSNQFTLGTEKDGNNEPASSQTGETSSVMHQGSTPKMKADGLPQLENDTPIMFSQSLPHTTSQDISMEESVQVSTLASCNQNQNQNIDETSESTSLAALNDSRYNLSSVSSMECIGCATECFRGSTGGNFLKGCKWSPDGSQIVTNSNDNHLRIFSPDERILLSSNRSLDPSCEIREKSQVYDFCWFPRMSSNQPDTCRVACSCSNIPIHLWDSCSGKTVSSYLAYDHCDEIIAAHSLAFSPDGSKLFSGFNRSIRIFDTERPGRTSRLLKTVDSKTKEGIRGIISCFAFSQDAMPVFAVGSYSRHVGIYDYASQQLIYMMHGQQGGVTHLKISPDGTKLYSGGRKDPEIICWDMRNMGHVLFTCLRDVQTNQRIHFDLSESGQYLVSGNHDGTVNTWNTLDTGEMINGEVIMKPCFSFPAHQDCVNGVSFNHQQGILATASGQRHFMAFDDDSDSDNSSMSVDDATSVRDNSLKLWKIPCT